jgi:hypothetical protein
VREARVGDDPGLAPFGTRLADLPERVL